MACEAPPGWNHWKMISKVIHICYPCLSYLLKNGASMGENYFLLPNSQYFKVPNIKVFAFIFIHLSFSLIIGSFKVVKKISTTKFVVQINFFLSFNFALWSKNLVFTSLKLVGVRVSAFLSIQIRFGAIYLTLWAIKLARWRFWFYLPIIIIIMCLHLALLSTLLCPCLF